MCVWVPFVKGNKEDPVKVAQEMRVVREKSGKLYFSPDEWRTAKQISSYFSRLAAAQRRQEAAGEHLVQEAESIQECDIQALETEQQLRELEAAVYAGVYDQVDLKHPVEFNGKELWSLAKEGKLKTKFTIEQLKEICYYLGLNIKGPIGRKQSYIGPIEQLVKTCGCPKRREKKDIRVRCENENTTYNRSSKGRKGLLDNQPIFFMQ